ncbi:MAG TPA: 3-deoxy-manno-octulosonate cytidylyltransferase [Gammaproteobacteria bacterium]|nr:3-deoxy-manno-octulosonate cytidylyltransferase [Gammaproteobacteria bacterium]
MQRENIKSTDASNQKILLIIPCRLKSKRLPRKVLLPIGNTPMVIKVFHEIKNISAFRRFVLCEDLAIKDVCDKYHVPVELSDKDCSSGTHRIASWLIRNQMNDNDIIVNIQGDEPFIETKAVDQVIHMLQSNQEAGVATLWSPLDISCAADPNRVKLVTTHNNRVIYFSRSLIPNMNRSVAQQKLYRMHIGLYAYRAWALKSYYHNKESVLSQQESLEQLSFIDQGIPVFAEKSKVEVQAGIDTIHDYQRVNQSLVLCGGVNT